MEEPAEEEGSYLQNEQESYQMETKMSEIDYSESESYEDYLDDVIGSTVCTSPTEEQTSNFQTSSFQVSNVKKSYTGVLQSFSKMGGIC